jgi:hypothetical protein
MADHPTETGYYWCNRHDTDGFEPVRVDEECGELCVVPLRESDAFINEIEKYTRDWVLEWGPRIDQPQM